MTTDLEIAFPMAEVEARLRCELIAAVKQASELGGAPWPQETDAPCAASIEIDSLVAVEILCAVEPVLRFELPPSVVRPGGYGSIDEAVEHLIPKIEREWRKRKGRG